MDCIHNGLHGRKDVVKLLLNHQARIIELRTKDICGRTPFMFACKNGHKGVVQLLLEHSELQKMSILTLLNLIKYFMYPKR